MAFAWFNFAAMVLTLLSQFNLLSVLTPRCFTKTVGYNIFPLNFIFMLESRAFLLGMKIIFSVSETFSVKPPGKVFRSVRMS